MAVLNYTNRLNNLQNRKFDTISNRFLVSESFRSRDLPEDVKYLVESMRPINVDYNQKTLDAAENVKKHLEREFSLHFSRAYRTQGSVKSATNIKAYSDIDLLAIIDKYVYPQSTPQIIYTASDPNIDIREFRKQATTILTSIYDEVDSSGENCVSIFNKSLRRKVDVSFCFWYDSDEYERTKEEYYRGVYIHKHPSGLRKRDFPFAHIHNVNVKGDSTMDGSRRAIRLLKNLSADSETKLNFLKSFQLTTVVHATDNQSLVYQPGQELEIAKAVSAKMGQIVDSPAYRRSIESPNGTEFPLSDDAVVPDIVNLKSDLDTLIQDTSKDLIASPTAKRILLTY